MRIGLVGCVKKKGPVAAPAEELYVSPLFVGRRRFVESTCDRWFILSALHGLVDPHEVIEPYDHAGADPGDRASPQPAAGFGLMLAFRWKTLSGS